MTETLSAVISDTPDYKALYYEAIYALITLKMEIENARSKPPELAEDYVFALFDVPLPSPVQEPTP